MRSFESNLLSQIDQEGRSGEYFTGDDKFDKKIAAWNKVRPRFSDFKEIYEPGEIEKDKATLQRIEADEGRQKARSTAGVALEYALMEVIHNNQTFGEASVVPTSKYDDYCRHIDLVVAFPGRKADRSNYLGIDTTTTSDVQVLDEKLKKTVNELSENRLPKVKYFIDDENPEKKGWLRLPRVVINVDAAKAMSIQKSLSAMKDYQLERDLQSELIEQIERQLVMGAVYLLENFHDEKAGKIASAEELVGYLEQNKKNISNQRLLDNVLAHTRVLENLILIKQKSPDQDKPNDFRAETLTEMLRKGRAF